MATGLASIMLIPEFYTIKSYHEMCRGSLQSSMYLKISLIEDGKH